MQSFDKNEFFRESTALICGTLDIDLALRRCYRYLSQVIPCDDLVLMQYDQELHAFRSVARTLTHQKATGNIAFMPLQGKKIWITIWEQAGEVLIINQPSEWPMYQQLDKSQGLKSDASFIILKLSIGEKKIGMFLVGARGTNRYTKAHADLVHVLQVPLAICMENALQHEELIRLKDIVNDNNRFLQCELNDLSGTEMIGAEGGLRHVMQMVRQVSQLDSPVLLEGETGTGKGLIASTIHRLSKRNEGPFISVNCGAIPDSLVDSELFGHEKGAFTGAIDQKRGRFERADKGTIFLDEVGELPYQAQVRLLHVLQNKEIERVGGSQTIPVDIRIISATNRNLAEMVRSGRFREDLWYRLNVFPIRIPPLRQRKEDIPALVDYFVIKKSVELNKPGRPALAPGTINKLLAYHWPGNVRELQNIIERALIQHTQGPLRFTDTAVLQNGENEDTPYTGGQGQFLPLETMTTAHIRRALELANGKINGPGGAAELLAINPNTLRKKMDKLQIPYKKRKQDRISERKKIDRYILLSTPV